VVGATSSEEFSSFSVTYLTRDQKCLTASKVPVDWYEIMLMHHMAVHCGKEVYNV